jgi:hypothetical protein
MDAITRTPLNTATGNGHVLNVVTGRALSRMLRGKAPRERAAVIAQLIEHDVAVVGLLATQGARLAGISSTEICVALGHNGSRGPHRKTIERLVETYGLPTLMKALDQAAAE